MMLAAMGAIAQARDIEEGERHEFAAMGYLASWTAYDETTDIANIDANRLTHILYAFGALTAEGDAELGDACADIGMCASPMNIGGNFAKLRALKLRHPHLKIMISFGGWNGSAHFSRVAAGEQGRRRFASSAIAVFLEPYNGLFDGIDIDWEYPVEGGARGNSRSTSDRTNFTLLMQEFRTQLDRLGDRTKRRYGLSVALAADAAMNDNVDLMALAAIVDTLNVMTYDYHVGSSYSHFNAPLYPVDNDPTPLATVDASVSSFRLVGVPSSKLVMGIPLYGRAYGGIDAINDGLLRPADSKAVPNWALDGVDLKALAGMNLEASGFAAHWNDKAKVPFSYNSAEKLWVSYEDARSVAAKIAYAREKSLAGVMIWHVGGDIGSLLEKLDLPAQR